LPEGSSTVWVDSNGRLVQARNSFTISAAFGASLREENPDLGDAPIGPRIFTSTLRLSAFGAPVHIAAPTLQPSDSTAFAVSGEVTDVARCG
jgi:hypothetical protein